MRIIIKVGTNVMRGGTEGVHRPQIINLARQIATLKAEGHTPILVSSGAVFAGQEILGVIPLKQKRDIHHRQMFAAVGQGHLMSLYQQIFALYDLTVAQALLTKSDLANRTRYLNARNSMLLLVQHGVIPIINENDTVAMDEIKFGDNDNLSALVANLVDADLLIILTDQLGLFTADPRKDDSAELLREVTVIDDRIKAMAGSRGVVGTGGMATKLQAAELATRSGTDVVIAPGSEADVILRIVKGDVIGTRFPTPMINVESRKRWILAETVQGQVQIDDGAVRALVQHDKSLLVVGLKAVVGEFERGATISIQTQQGQEVGRGLANYKADDLQQIRGLQSHQISQVLGYDYGPTAVHRDNLMVL